MAERKPAANAGRTEQRQPRQATADRAVAKAGNADAIQLRTLAISKTEIQQGQPAIARRMKRYS